MLVQVKAPSVIALTAGNPSADFAFGPGDTVAVAFDADTNRGGALAAAGAMASRAGVGAMYCAVLCCAVLCSARLGFVWGYCSAVLCP